ncbi:hypothetical protein [Flagellimonas sp. S3867]|uniref:hypothetical protein n=1 Tax=Flagellimonas sp. S3867 TaxID=2768063 RepID=UPI001686AB5E|nr:hypothetical protein [Flagellimonas sp. S3867]
MLKNYTCFFFLLLTFNVFPQEIQKFRVNDFDLRGKVKSCLVITDYGRELFEFSEDGLLIRTVTQYNETDQDITYYKYTGEELMEKRMESYKNNVLDAATSMVNFYTIDTVPLKKIFEKIISYDKEFLELQEYEFDKTNRLTKITTSNAEGVDETILEYASYKDESTVNHFVNEVMEKSVRTSERKTSEGIQKAMLTKEYIDGEPNIAFEEIFDEAGKLISKETFSYDIIKKEFVSNKKKLCQYDVEGKLEKVVTKTSNAEAVKEYIFQFDNNEEKNWIKQIITPDNSYVTRKITYYPNEQVQEEPNK